MSDLLELAKAYQKSSTLEERQVAAEALARLLYPPITLYLARRLGPGRSEDAVQETLVAIFRGLNGAKARSENEFRGWCFRIASNKANDALRREYRDKTVALETEDLENVLAAEKPGLSTAELEQLNYVLSLLSVSKFPCVDLLWDYLVVKLSFRELGIIHEVSEDGVRMRFNRCLAAARAIARNLS